MACGRGMVPGVGMPGLGAGFGVPDFVGSVKVGVAALAGVAVPPGFGIPGFAVAPGFGAPGFAAGPGLTALLAPPAPGFGAPGLAAGVDCVDFAAGAS